MNWLSGGIVVAVIAVLAQLANAFGYPVLGHWLADPQTAAQLTTCLTAGMTLAAGMMAGLKKTPAP